MSHPTTVPAKPTRSPPANLDAIVEAFEDAYALDNSADLADYLPANDDPNFTQIAVELIRVDLECSQNRGIAKRLEDYVELAPKLFCDADALSQIGYEEYRLRRLAGDNVDLHEYGRRFGIDTEPWPTWNSNRLNGNQRFSGPTDQLGVESKVFPTVGDRFDGFELIEQLGRGAFGVVFRARQLDLAAREVVIKLSAPRSVEPQRLARLQHTNIVPIYSVHAESGWLGICMPYLGRATLADVLRAGLPPTDEQGRLSTVAVRDAETIGPLIPSSSESTIKSSSELRSSTAKFAGEHFSIDEIVEMFAQLAEGLSHAHQRGIVHSDLKPANILLGDDGTPLLLDFNLSDDASAAPRATLMVGGTLPYMSPEHLQAILDGGTTLPECDIYSLGVIFFEMLTRQRPVPPRDAASEDDVIAMIQDRIGQAPSVRCLNPAVSPSIDAVVSRCLDPDVRCRYANAAELAEDLRRHQTNLPLLHTREPSVRERCKKWFRRHARSTRVASVIGLLILLASVSTWAALHQNRLHDLEAASAFANFQNDALTANLNLHAPGAEPELHKIGREAAIRALGRFAALEGESQSATAQLSRLSATQQTEFRQESLKLQYALADSPLGKERLISQARLPADTVAYLRGLKLLENGDFEPASREWETLCKLDRHDPVRWFLLGNAYRGSARLSDADACYTAVIALQPQAMSGFFYRGLCRYEQRRYADAEQDFSAVLELRPALPSALLNRALVWQALGAYENAERDATAAIRDGIRDPRAFFVRANIRESQGNKAGAKTDRDRGFSLEPIDDLGWIARGIARLRDDPQKARVEFEKGLSKFPNSTALLENLVHVYADRLSKPDLALEIADRRVEQNPKDPSALASRAVLNARLGHRTKAHADAKLVAAGRVPPLTFLQLACVYAITTKSSPSDKAAALRHLQWALVGDPRLVSRAIDDPDLETIRNTPEFKSLVSAAERLVGTSQLSNNEDVLAAPSQAYSD